MRQGAQIISIFVCLFALSSIGQGQSNLTVSYSPLCITKAMDFAVRSNYSGYLYTQGSSQIDSIYKENKQPDSLKLRNPNTALFYAAVPGFFVHGAGHFYAGKTKTGIALLGVEIISVGLLFRYVLTDFAASMDGGTGGEPETIVGVIGGTLFVGSWIYDIIGAPLTIDRENEKILEKKAMAKQRI
ncbi:MAG: hypothetical protein Q8O10_03000 [candidate division Zixibacteria bacterium]|nr:hypothetical protein [candidate division Zixibacteria bacterium]